MPFKLFGSRKVGYTQIMQTQEEKDCLLAKNNPKEYRRQMEKEVRRLVYNDPSLLKSLSNVKRDDYDWTTTGVGKRWNFSHIDGRFHAKLDVLYNDPRSIDLPFDLTGGLYIKFLPPQPVKRNHM